MSSDWDRFDAENTADEGSGSFLGLALLAMAAGAGAALLFAPAEGSETRKLVGGRLRDLGGGAGHAFERVQHELGRRKARRRRDTRLSALAGLAVGAGIAALFVPESGAETRRRLAESLRRGREQAEQGGERVVREPQPEPTV
jgi:gas vesicle protein